MSLHNDRERSLARCDDLLHQEIQEYRLNFTKEQDELERKVFLRKFQVRVVGRHHSNRKVEAPDATEDRQSDKWDEV